MNERIIIDLDCLEKASEQMTVLCDLFEVTEDRMTMHSGDASSYIFVMLPVVLPAKRVVNLDKYAFMLSGRLLKFFSMNSNVMYTDQFGYEHDGIRAIYTS